MTSPEPTTFARLPDRALIRLGGPDWRSFLQGLLTQDIDGLGQGDTRYAALLTPQGRLLYDMFVIAEGEGAWLDVAAETRDALLARLRMYRLRAKVELEAAAGEVTAAWGGEPAGPGWRPDPRLRALGWRGVDQSPPAGAEVVGLDQYQHHRLELGVADLSRDGLADKAYALEANLDLLHGVDFHKGCFVGQETTSRMKRRSVVKSRLLPLRFQGPPPRPGAEVLAGDLRAGVVHSGVEGLALGLMRLDRAIGAVLTVEDRPVRLDVPDWLESAVRDAVEQGAE
jgi:tRNA-modifying protein YgfZ